MKNKNNMNLNYLFLHYLTIIFFCLILHLNCIKSIKIENEIDISKLLSQMSVNEKCGQMTQITVEVLERNRTTIKPDENPIDLDKLRKAIVDYKIGL